MSPRSSAALWLGLVVIAAPARAEASSPLTLTEALRLAANQNEVPRIASARLSRARALRREALAQLLPSLTSASTYTRRANEVRRDFGGQSTVVQAEDALESSAILTLDLFDARAYAGLSVTKSQLEAQSFDSTELRRELAFDVAESFYAVLSAERLVAAANKRVNVAEETAADARSRVEAGLAARNEATRTELELATARLADQEAHSTADKARLALGYLLGEQVLERPLAEPELRPGPAQVPEALEKVAASQRSDLKALEARTDAARAMASEPWLRLIPTLSARGLGRLSNEPGIVGRNLDGNLSATLTWELYDGGARYARAEAEAAALEEAELNGQAARRRLSLEIRTALADLKNAEASVYQAEVRASVASQNADEVRALFSSGLASALEQVDASVSEFEASAELARQRVQRRVADLSLFRALGEWPLGAQEGEGGDEAVP